MTGQENAIIYQCANQQPGNYTVSTGNLRSAVIAAYVFKPILTVTTTATTTISAPKLKSSFTETGLPWGSIFTVTYDNMSNAATVTSSNARVAFSPVSAPQGTYRYWAHNATYGGILYRAEPSVGSLLSGSNVTLNYTSSTTTIPLPSQKSSFVETGLPKGSVFTVTYAGMTNSVTVASANASSAVSFTLPQGSYAYAAQNAVYNSIFYYPKLQREPKAAPTT